jgi:hypothetical protein
MPALPVAPEGDALVIAAYGLAVRITGDENRAVEVLEATPLRAAPSPVAYLNAVRRAARRRRPSTRPIHESATPPARLADLSVADWEVVERVVLRGMSLTEVAQVLEIDRSETLLRLNRGMLAARDRLLGGKPGDDTHSAGRDRLDGDLPAGRLDDAARDRQAETAPARTAA